MRQAHRADTIASRLPAHRHHELALLTSKRHRESISAGAGRDNSRLRHILNVRANGTVMPSIGRLTARLMPHDAASRFDVGR